MRRDFSKHLLLVILAGLTFFPFVFMIVTSLKDNPQFYARFWGILPFRTGIPWLEPLEMTGLHWENYLDAWKAIRHYVLNSFIVTSASVVGVLAVASLAAYAFARHKFPGSGILFYAILSLMMIPGVLTLISSYMWMKQFPVAGGNNWLGLGGKGFINSYWVLILPYVAGGQVFAIFILRTFFGGLPEELFEAARIDGAGEFQQFRHIAIPLSKPILGTIAIMNILGTWNDYIWPSITLLDDEKRTLVLGLLYFQGQHSTTYGPLLAGYTLASLPLLVLFLFTMRYFIEGLTSGAFKA
jgi:ABC-type glycerol-3-phosphate transport system permease component